MQPKALPINEGNKPSPVSDFKITSEGLRHKFFAWGKQTFFAIITFLLIYDCDRNSSITSVRMSQMDLGTGARGPPI